MQIKSSITTLALATLIVTSVPAQGLYNPLSTEMGTTLKNHCTLKHAALFALVASIYRFNDRKPTKEPSRADWAKLDADLEGKSIKEQLLIIIEFIHHYIDDEIIGHKDKSPYMKAEDKKKITVSEEIPGRGMYYQVFRHKDAIMKTLSAPIILAVMYKMLVTNHTLMGQIVEGEISLPGLVNTLLGLGDDATLVEIKAKSK